MESLVEEFYDVVSANWAVVFQMLENDDVEEVLYNSAVEHVCCF